MPADCSAPQLVFEGFEGHQVVGGFDGGAVALREAERAIGLTARVARCFTDTRCKELVVHEVETLVAQRMHGIALGYEDLNDHDELRHDPVLALLSDTLTGGTASGWPHRANRSERVIPARSRTKLNSVVRYAG